MDSNEIRQRFFTFFEERDHTRVPSSSLVSNDPSLLLANAGMNQFLPYFTKEQTAPFDRAMSIQKCFRTPDIDEVGKTTRHLTFFEMLGNFSFGDYFKEAAAAWAWELVTEGYGLDPERLWATVYLTDDEAHEIWADSVGVRPDRIVRRGRKDNFWSMGANRPCGPCSEIFVDLGEAYGPAASDGPETNEDRYLEIWNLVFMQNECNVQLEPIGDLPTKNIDTGAGVERLAFVLQKVGSIYETDTIGALIERSSELTGARYGVDARSDTALRILADHGRGIAFLIADGVLPSNEKRGYVLRRVMRRAIREARLLGREEPILPELVDTTVELMNVAYPELKTRRDFIIDVAAREEERFDQTLKQGLTLLSAEIEKATGAGATKLPDDVAFRLHDTFGFPIDVTRDVAAESGLTIDNAEFARQMEEQRTRARSARGGDVADPSAEVLGSLVEERGTTEFIGYEHLTTTATVVGLAADGTSLPVATDGQNVEMVLDRSVFYAEGGGQVGDRGTIEGPDGAARVTDTRRLVPGVIGHHVTITDGDLKVGDEVTVRVDAGWRAGAQRAHTATHILHWALRDRLGEHATQAGSLVEPGRLRFDFHHYEPLGDEGVAAIGEGLQDKVLVDDPVRAFETSFDYAKSIGAMAIFGEKYGDFVRVVEVGEYSKELCGGTHVPHTSQIGVVVVTGEGSVGANLRRVEALVGREGISYLARRGAELQRAADLLKTSPDEVAEKVERLLATQKDMEKRIAAVERSSAESDAERLAGSAVDVDGARLVVARRDLGVDGLRSLAQTLKGKLGSAVIVLGAAGEGRANLVGAVTKDLVSRGVSARDILAPGAELLGGGAGGKPELAISGGPSADRLDHAIEAAAEAARVALRR